MKPSTKICRPSLNPDFRPQDPDHRHHRRGGYETLYKYNKLFFNLFFEPQGQDPGHTGGGGVGGGDYHGGGGGGGGWWDAGAYRGSF